MTALLTGLAGLSQPYLVLVACGSAFVGAFVGAKLIEKVTLRAIQIIVSALLTLISLGLLTGLI